MGNIPFLIPVLLQDKNKRVWKGMVRIEMEGIDRQEKRKLVFYRNLIDSLLSLEEYMNAGEEEVSEVLVQRMGQLYRRTAAATAKTLCGLEMTEVLEEMLDIVHNAQGEKEESGFQQMIPPVSYQERDYYGKTELFEPDYRADMENAYVETTLLGDALRFPFLIRKSTNEKILINRDVFKMGKEKSYVDYYVENDAVSRSHADIIRKKDSFFMIDQNSLNHTFLEGRKLPPKQYVKLESGQSFMLADEEFVFYYEPYGKARV